MAEAVYGAPPQALAEVDPEAVQTSPFVIGSTPLETLEAGSLDRAVVLAPPGTVERRYAVAQMLRSLRPGAELVVLAPKDKGGSRLKKELQAFGCEVEEWSKAHHRICVVERPSEPVGVDEAIAEGAPRVVASLGLWSQPGVFSWDRPDPGSLLLIDKLPPLSGRGVDLGCGVGLLAKAALASPAVSELMMLDLDRRAVEAARKNITDPRARIEQADATEANLEGLDFVVMNPPFHGEGHEDRNLGVAFISTAAKALRKGGTLWMVANRHLPYEPALTARFHRVTLVVETGGYKVYEALKG